MGLPYLFELQGYCENCPEFSPELETEEHAAEGGRVRRQHTIRCVHRLKCAGIVEHIAGQVIP